MTPDAMEASGERRRRRLLAPLQRHPGAPEDSLMEKMEDPFSTPVSLPASDPRRRGAGQHSTPQRQTRQRLDLMLHRRLNHDDVPASVGTCSKDGFSKGQCHCVCDGEEDHAPLQEKDFFDSLSYDGWADIDDLPPMTLYVLTVGGTNPLFDLLPGIDTFRRVEDMVRSAARAFHDRYRHIDIEVLTRSDLKALERDIRDLKRDGGGNRLVDGFVVPTSWTAMLAQQGRICDLTDVVESKNVRWDDVLYVYRSVLTNYNSRVYMVPLDGDLHSLFYRKDVLDYFDEKSPRTWDEYNRLAARLDGKSYKGTTLIGSCVGRKPGCTYGGAHWAHLILSSMTQTFGTSFGSLFDPEDMEPLMGPAMYRTLEILETQVKHGAPNEFSNCGGGGPESTNLKYMNEGRCVLTYNWGDSFRAHMAEGSVFAARNSGAVLGVAPTPGSTLVLDRETKRLVDCTRARCPNSQKYDDLGFVNRPPYAAFGGWGGAVSSLISDERRDVMKQFMAFASTVLGEITPPNATAPVEDFTFRDPYRRSQLDLSSWVDQGFDGPSLLEYRDTLIANMEIKDSRNIVMDVRVPEGDKIMSALDEEVAKHLKIVRQSQRRKLRVAPYLEESRREDVASKVANRWEGIISSFEQATGVSMLDLYRESRGLPPKVPVVTEEIPIPPPSTSENVAGLVVGVALAIALLTSIGAFFLVRREKRKQMRQWYIRPEDIRGTDKILGSGSFGTVTQGFLRGNPVALKRAVTRTEDLVPIDDSAASSSGGSDSGSGRTSIKVTEALANELLLLVKLRHPCIVQTYGATTIKGELILVFQCMKNGTIADILADENSVAGSAGKSIEIQWALQVATGLNFLHEYSPPDGPILHNDLKSSNVLLDSSYNAAIADFGLAAGVTKGKSKRLSSGSLLWMAPEVLISGQRTAKADVYSFGMFVCELLTRARPYNVVLATDHDEFVRRRIGIRLIENGESFLDDQNGLEVESDLNGTSSHGPSDLSTTVETERSTQPVSEMSTESCGQLGSKHPRRLSSSLLCISEGRYISCNGNDKDHSPHEIDEPPEDETKENGNSQSSEGAGAFSTTEELKTTKKYTRGCNGVIAESLRDLDCKSKMSLSAAELDRQAAHAKGANVGTRPQMKKSSSVVSILFKSTMSRYSTKANAKVEAKIRRQRRVSDARMYIGSVGGERFSREEIIDKVKDLSLDPQFRPDLPEDAPHILRDICVECWNKNPNRRPTMREIVDRLGAFASNSLTQQLIERGNVFDSILPEHVQDALARGEQVPPESFEDATVIFSDIVGFTTISSALSAEEVGDLISRLFIQFDDLCKKHGVKKLDVIGDAFLGVAGVPDRGPNHASKAAKFAIEAVAIAEATPICPSKPELGKVRVRFGLATGPVVAQVIGGAEYVKYTLFGDTVNTASRMESCSEPNRVHCTTRTAEKVRRESPDIDVDARASMIQVKGKGEMQTYWLSQEEVPEIPEELVNKLSHAFSASSTYNLERPHTDGEGGSKNGMFPKGRFRHKIQFSESRLMTTTPTAA